MTILKENKLEKVQHVYIYYVYQNVIDNISKIKYIGVKNTN